MSLRTERNLELEKVFYDFMNYYYYKNNWNKGKWHKKWHKMPYPCYDIDLDGDCDNLEYYHKNKYHKHYNKPYPKPYKKPYTTLPYYYNKDNRAEFDYEEERAVNVLEPAQMCNENETFPVVYKPTPESYEAINDMGRMNHKTEEQEYYKSMFKDINKTLMYYVEQVMREYNYEGSPINDEYFSRESLAQIVDTVIERAKENRKLAEFVNDLDPRVPQLVRNMAQALVLGELFVVHRPNTKLNTNNMAMEFDMPERYNNYYGDPKNSKPLGESMDKYLYPNTNVDYKDLKDKYEKMIDEKTHFDKREIIQKFSN